MKNAIILHGTGGSPKSNWFHWLEDELLAKELQVFLPSLPNTKQPSLRDNVDFVHVNCPFPINKETLIVGHSSGAILALILAQENPVPVGGVVAVSVFHDNSLEWEALNRLFDIDFNWQQIKAKTSKLLFIHSDTDPYVPLDQAKYVANNCEAEMLVLPGQGHFNLEQGDHYKLFPKLLEIMEQEQFLAPKLIVFQYAGEKRQVSFVEAMQVKEGVTCDIYTFDQDASQDLAIVHVAKGYSTPRQKILKGDVTLEGFMSGAGSLRVESQGKTTTHTFKDTPNAEAIEVKVGDIMQWTAARESDLTFYEICRPPYEDGRFENLDNEENV